MLCVELVRESLTCVLYARCPATFCLLKRHTLYNNVQRNGGKIILKMCKEKTSDLGGGLRRGRHGKGGEREIQSHGLAAPESHGKVLV